MKVFLFLITFAFNWNIIKAEKIAQGYIITLKNDTLHGTFNLQKVKVKEGTLFKPFNWAMFSLSVNFISKDGEEKEYLPQNLKGFDFDFDGVQYKFRSLKIGSEELQSFFSDGAPTEVFAQIHVEDSPISFYIFRFNYDVFRRYKGRSNLNNYYYNYYAKTPAGLVRIDRTFKKNELFTILKDILKLEESFIETIPKKDQLGELQEVIESYNLWKRKK
jgi:hypothetical protein